MSTRAVVRGAAMLLTGLLVAACGGTRTTTVTVAPAAPTTPAGGLQAQYIAVVKATQPDVVQIRTSSGLGSGVVFDTNGDIVTNAHVVSSENTMEVTLSDGRRFTAHLVGTYPPDDLAVMSIGAGHGITPARFADSSKLMVGDIVLAVGNPLGLQSSVTDGIVSALGRDVSESEGVVLPNAIQTSAAINPGNSGGALINLSAQVIGIPTLAAVNPELGSAASGIGFAIPSNTVTDIAGQIVQHGRVVSSHRAALGVNVADSQSRRGAVVASVQSGGAADRAGIHPGDAIVKIDGTEIASVSDLTTALAGSSRGTSRRCR